MTRNVIARICVMSLAVVAIWFVADARGELLFSDNCNSTTSSSNINTEIANRTAGTYAGTTYTYTSSSSATHVGESAYANEYLRLGTATTAAGYAFMWLNQQLKGDDSAGGLELTWTSSITLTQGAYNGSWFTVGIGADAIGTGATYRPLVGADADGVFLGFYLGKSDGAQSPCNMFVFEKAANKSPSPLPVWLSGGLEAPAVDHTFVMKVTGVGSDNPFSAVTPLNIKLYVDGAATPVLDYTTVNNYPNNYIGMMSYGYCRFNLDSWSVSQIPEPSTLVLMTCGLVGLLAYAWRKRK